MHYCPIASTLGYVLSPDGEQVLMVHRLRPEDEQCGKYNGLGGRLEPNEDVASGMSREIFEEAGIEVATMRFRGTVNWTGFGPDGADWLGFVFLVTAFRGTPRAGNDDGPLEWVDVRRLSELPMWEGDAYFLPLVFDDDPRPFHAYLPYENGRPTGWHCTRA